ncbi:low density lipoprotein receptor-related protein 5-like protein [Sarcoptes scabiei]|uniref:Low density lipoprotein receptor-related protein 5-like protein n=1 Tax=Sarcoptes scabiei TaxID=52283 RepID=A0A132AAX7_SARSC|nr:low density lipoprotein receptor-related protein 5-like protein [Sarcoptes scabiei]
MSSSKSNTIIKRSKKTKRNPSDHRSRSSKTFRRLFNDDDNENDDEDDDDDDDVDDDRDQIDRNCSPEQLYCAALKKCLPFSSLCDGHVRCPDQIHDELKCSQNHSNNHLHNHHQQLNRAQHYDQNRAYRTECYHDQFECKDRSGCIHLELRCDGQNDCEDQSDESDCQCRLNEFRCSKQFQCIDIKFRYF